MEIRQFVAMIVFLAMGFFAMYLDLSKKCKSPEVFWLLGAYGVIISQFIWGLK